MAPNPRLQDQRLQELYDQLPQIDCAGLCHDSCGPIQMSIRERTRIEGLAGEPITCGFGPSCSMLTTERKCSVYTIRPLICRLWGLMRSMPCPYGCRPERVVEDDEAMALLVAAEEIGGSAANRERDMVRQLALQRRVLGEEEIRLRARQAARKLAVRPRLDGRHHAARSIFED